MELITTICRDWRRRGYIKLKHLWRNVGFMLGQRFNSNVWEHGLLQFYLFILQINLPAWKVGDRGLEPHSDLQVSMKQNVSTPLTRKDSILWGASVTQRQRARLQTARALISNPVSGGQCHLIHLTIVRRLSWPILAYVHKCKPYSCISMARIDRWGRYIIARINNSGKQSQKLTVLSYISYLCQHGKKQDMAKVNNLITYDHYPAPFQISN